MRFFLPSVASGYWFVVTVAVAVKLLLLLFWVKNVKSLSSTALAVSPFAYSCMLIGPFFCAFR